MKQSKKQRDMKRIYKKHIEELKSIVKEKGYWSDEVMEFVSQWQDYNAQSRLHCLARTFDKNNK